MALLGVRGTSLVADLRPDITRGPRTISDEEAAITADPAKGVEHGVILLEETVRNDSFGYATKLQFHRRAKILSMEGRSLADVEVELNWDENIEDWWGSTMLPDGTHVDVKDDNVKEQVRVRDGAWSTRVVKIPLPGVVPGSVIDYGYTIVADTGYRFLLEPLQQDWPVRKLRYCWKFPEGIGAAYSVHRGETLDLRVQHDRDSVLLEAANVPKVTREAYMPPVYDTEASLSLYYLRSGDRVDGYWNDQAKQIDKANRLSVQDPTIQTLLAVVEKNGNDGLDSKLKASYDWILANVQNRRIVRVSSSGDEAPSTQSASMNQLFASVARKLGVEAYVIQAPDRRRNTWDPSVHSIDQLPIRLVAVRLPGTSWDQVTVVDLNSGLPYGEVPWWVTGVDGLLATAEGARTVFLKPSSAKNNLSHVSVELAFSDDRSRLTARWHRISKGQSGLDEAQELGDTTEKTRKERVARMCGQGPDMDAIQSDAKVGYPPLIARLDCETRSSMGADDPDTASHLMSWSGPWVGPVPDLPPGPRVHPVVFAFPRTDILELSVKVPNGFRPKEAPEGVSLVGPYGKYKLAISVTPEGFTVQRAFAVFPVSVPPAEYDALRAFLADVRRADATTLGYTRGESPH